MLKLKLQYSGHLMWRANSLEKTLMKGKIEGKRRRGQQRMRYKASSPQWTWIWANSRRSWRTRKPGVLQSMGLQRVRLSVWTTARTGLLCKGINRIHKGSTFLTQLPLKALLGKIPSHWELDFNKWMWGDTNIQSITASKCALRKEIISSCFCLKLPSNVPSWWCLSPEKEFSPPSVVCGRTGEWRKESDGRATCFWVALVDGYQIVEGVVFQLYKWW